MSGPIEQSGRLRQESPPKDRNIVVRGGRDSLDKLATHVARTATLWNYNGEPQRNPFFKTGRTS